MKIKIKEFLIKLINIYLGDDQPEPIEKEKTKIKKKEKTEDWWWAIGGK